MVVHGWMDGGKCFIFTRDLKTFLKMAVKETERENLKQALETELVVDVFQ
jgi:hypothetical protein